MIEMVFSRDAYLKKLIERQNNGLIKIITGARRAGKSYLMNELYYHHLISSGTDERHIIRFAFDSDEDIDLLEDFLPELPTRIPVPGKKNLTLINARKFRAWLSSATNDTDMFYLLLDEVQLLENFVGTMNSLLRHSNFDICITGSNSRFLSKDIATEFKGRGSEIHVLPLTFAEYISGFSGTQEEAWRSYLETGGLPVVAQMRTRDEQIDYLRNLCDEVYLKDIVERNGLRNDAVLADLFSVLSSCIGSGINPTIIANTFQSVLHKKVTDDTMNSYLRCLEDAYVVSKADKYEISGRKYISAPYKVYFEDIGVRNARLNFKRIEEGHLLENIIYNELRSRGFSVSVGQLNVNEMTDRISASGKKIYKQKALEVDFVAVRGNQQYYLQVCLHMDDDQTVYRESRPLTAIRDSFQKIIITKDGLRPRRDEQGIIIMDVFDFLLNPNLQEIL